MKVWSNNLLLFKYLKLLMFNVMKEGLEYFFKNFFKLERFLFIIFDVIDICMFLLFVFSRDFC